MLISDIYKLNCRPHLFSLYYWFGLLTTFIIWRFLWWHLKLNQSKKKSNRRQKRFIATLTHESKRKHFRCKISLSHDFIDQKMNTHITFL